MQLSVPSTSETSQSGEKSVGKKKSASTPRKKCSPHVRKHLFWPATPKTKSSRFIKRKLPSAISSANWRALEEEQGKGKQKKGTGAKERAKITKEPSLTCVKNEDFNGKVNKDSSKQTEVTQRLELKSGDYVLVRFTGGKKESSTYKYVCSVLRRCEDKSLDEYYVLVLRCQNSKRTLFVASEEESRIAREQIEEKLPIPNLKLEGSRVKYEFATSITNLIEAM